MEEEIKAEFVKNGFSFDEEEEILQKCLTFCNQYQRSASDLVSSWDVYSINRGLEFIVRNSHMSSFLEELLNEQKEKIKGKQSGLHLYYNDVEMLLNGDDERNEGLLESPPEKQPLSRDMLADSAVYTDGSKIASEERLKPVTPFGTRTNKFVLHYTLNENLATVEQEGGLSYSDDDIIKRVQPIHKCSLLVSKSYPHPACRFMYDRIEDKFNFLEDRIKKRAIAYVSSGQYEEPVDPSMASQKGIFTVGMICCDEEGHLKEKPVLLQSSVENSGGQRVRLDLQKLSQFSVFPGQVVGVEGHNPSGHCLIASKIIEYIPSPITSSEENPTKRQALDSDLQLASASHVSMVCILYSAFIKLFLRPRDREFEQIVAAGPFTTSENLFFEPLAELLSYSLRKQPQVLLLVLSGHVSSINRSIIAYVLKYQQILMKANSGPFIMWA